MWSPALLKSLDTALRTSEWLPIKLKRMVGGTLIFSPPYLLLALFNSAPSMTAMIDLWSFGGLATESDRSWRNIHSL